MFSKVIRRPQFTEPFGARSKTSFSARVENSTLRIPNLQLGLVTSTLPITSTEMSGENDHICNNPHIQG